MLLREIGIPFASNRIARMQGAHKQPECLKLNPNGLFPVLVGGELVLHETATVCLHLADTHRAGTAAGYGRARTSKSGWPG